MSASYVFNSVFLMQLIPYLTPISYIMLRRAHPIFIRGRHYPSVASLCLARFERVLIDTFTLPRSMCDALMRALREKRLTLTGGVLLSLLQGDTIDPAEQDIDLSCAYFNGWYDNRECYEPLFGPIKDFNFQHVGNDDNGSEITNQAFNVRPLLLRTECLPMYQKCDVFVSVHEHTESDTQRNLNALPGTFDLSICGNTLCGDRLLLRDALGIVNQRCSVELNFYLRSVRVDADVTDVEARFLRQMERREKYRRRGYQIDVITKWTPPSEVWDYLRDVRVSVSSTQALILMGRRELPSDQDSAYWVDASNRRKPAMRQKIYDEWKRCWEKYGK